jgi:multicomponent K+:H+ antiporter subunit D
LPALALATIALGTFGAFAARRFALIAANAVLISTGTLLFAIAARDPSATAALLYYLPHTTLVTGGLFLLGHALSTRRGELADQLVRGPVIAGRTSIGLAFLVLAVAVSGLPPLSGFVGKLMLMQGAPMWQAAWWATLLLSGLGIALVMARAGSLLFWEPEGRTDSAITWDRIGPRSATALGALVLASPALVLAAAPIAAFASATSAELHARSPYVSAVIAADATIARDRRPGPVVLDTTP